MTRGVKLAEKQDAGCPHEGGGPLFTPRYLSAVAALFFVSGGNWIILSPLTLYVEANSGSEFVAGFIVTGYSVGALITRLFASPFISARNYGWVVAFGAVVFGASSLLVVFADLNVLAVLAARFVQGLGQGVSSVAIQAGVAYMLPASRLGPGISIVGTATILSLAAFPPISLSIVSLASGIYDGCLLVLAASTVFMAVTLALGIYLQSGIPKGEGPDLSTARASTSPKEGRKKLYKRFERGAVLPSIANAAVTYCQGFATAFIALFCAAKGFDGAGLFFAAFAGAVVVVRLVSARIASRYSPRSATVLGFFLGIVGMAAMPFVPNAVIWVPAVLFGVCAGLVGPHMQVLAVSSCSPDGAGSSTGLFLACVDVSMLVSAVSGGLIIEGWGYTSGFASCAALLVAGLGVYLLSVRGRLDGQG